MLTLAHWVGTAISDLAILTASNIIAIFVYSGPSQWRQYCEERAREKKRKSALTGDEDENSTKRYREFSAHGTRGNLYFVQDAKPNWSTAMYNLWPVALFGGDRSPTVLNIVLGIAAVVADLLTKQWYLALAVALLAAIAHAALCIMWRSDKSLVEVVIRSLQYRNFIPARPRKISLLDWLREDPTYLIRLLLFKIWTPLYEIGKHVGDSLFRPLYWCYHQLEELVIPIIFVPNGLLLMVKPFVYASGTYAILAAIDKIVDRLPLVDDIDLHSPDYAAIYIGELAVLVLFGSVMVSVLQGRQQSLESRISALGQHLEQHIESMLPKLDALSSDSEIEGFTKATNALQNLSYEITAAIADHSSFRELEFFSALGRLRDSLRANNIASRFYERAEQFYSLVRQRSKASALTRIFYNVLIGFSMTTLALAAGVGKYTNDPGYVTGSFFIVLFALVWASQYAFSNE
jgi:type IV secretory pathway TrbD component